MPQGTRLKSAITENCRAGFDLAADVLCSLTGVDSVFPSAMTG